MYPYILQRRHGSLSGEASCRKNSRNLRVAGFESKLVKVDKCFLCIQFQTMPNTYFKMNTTTDAYHWYYLTAKFTCIFLFTAIQIHTGNIFSYVIASLHNRKFRSAQTIFRTVGFLIRKIKSYGIPLNSMELRKGSIKSHGTRKYGKSAMEFHGTFDLNHMELFDENKFQWALTRYFQCYFDT